MTATLTITELYGELNSQQINEVDVNQPSGSALLVLGLIQDTYFDTYWNVIVNFPRIKPRICIAAEDRDVKPRC